MSDKNEKYMSIETISRLFNYNKKLLRRQNIYGWNRIVSNQENVLMLDYILLRNIE